MSQFNIQDYNNDYSDFIEEHKTGGKSFPNLPRRVVEPLIPIDPDETHIDKNLISPSVSSRTSPVRSPFKSMHHTISSPQKSNKIMQQVVESSQIVKDTCQLYAKASNQGMLINNHQLTKLAQAAETNYNSVIMLDNMVKDKIRGLEEYREKWIREKDSLDEERQASAMLKMSVANLESKLGHLQENNLVLKEKVADLEQEREELIAQMEAWQSRCQDLMQEVETRDYQKQAVKERLSGVMNMLK